MLEYSPNEGDGEESDRFWNDMDRTLDSVGNGYRLYIPEYLNEWIGDRTRAVIAAAFGVPEENDNGKRVVEFAKEVDSMWVTHISSTEVCISNQEWQGILTVWRLKAL